MDSKDQKLKKIQQGRLLLPRLKKYTVLIWRRFFFWVAHLWQLWQLWQFQISPTHTLELALDSKYQKLKKIQQGRLLLRRLKKYAVLYGVGFFFWVAHLWHLLLVNLNYIDDHWLLGWTIGLFRDEPPPKIYPIIQFLDILGLIAFLIGLTYAIYWIHADCYCESVETQSEVSFKKHLAVAVVVNLVAYSVLRLITQLLV